MILPPSFMNFIDITAGNIFTFGSLSLDGRGK
jgi:hypothetical protein